MAAGKPEKQKMPMGAVLKANLKRLDLTEEVVKTSEIVKRVESRTGKKITRQRISALINAIYIEPATIAWLAEGLGVKPEELTREPE